MVVVVVIKTHPVVLVVHGLFEKLLHRSGCRNMECHASMPGPKASIGHLNLGTVVFELKQVLAQEVGINCVVERLHVRVLVHNVLVQFVDRGVVRVLNTQQDGVVVV